MRPAVRRLLFTPIVLVGAVLVLEGASRLLLRGAVLTTISAEEVKAHITIGGDIVYDPVLGWRRSALPNPTLGLDSNGFRHAEVSREKPPGVVRGFALGDSQTYGAGVKPAEAYPAVTESALRARGHSVELINTGLSGYRSRQALRLLRTKLVDFDPDFVVIDCQGHDDVRDEQPPQAGGVRETAARLLFYSRLYRGVRIGVQQVSARLHPGQKADLVLPSFAVRSPLPTQARPGNHDLILDFARARGIEVFFVDYPFGAERPMPLLKPPDLPAGARLVHTVPALLATGLATRALFLDNNHLTARGSAIVGEQVAKAVGDWLDGREGAAAP